MKKKLFGLVLMIAMFTFYAIPTESPQGSQEEMISPGGSCEGDSGWCAKDPSSSGGF